MSRTLSMVAVFALFLSGIVAGALGMHLYYAHGHAGAWGHRPGHPDPSRGFRDAFWMERLVMRLDLTPEQRDEVRAILDESRRQREALRRELEPRVREQIEATHRRLMEVLTPEQRDRLERMRREFRKRRPRRPPPDGPPPMEEPPPMEGSPPPQPPPGS